jgi:hypothetical protein
MAILRDELIEAATGKKRPPKSQIDKLVQAFGLKIYSAKHGAPFKIQQKFEDQFMALYRKMSDKYSYIDMDSSAFWSSLESQAKVWWEKQPMRGAGKNW